MMVEVIGVAIQTRKRLLVLEIVVGLLSYVVHGRIAIAVGIIDSIGAPESGVEIIWQVIGIGKHIIVIPIFRMLAIHHVEAVAGRHWGWRRLAKRGL